MSAHIDQQKSLDPIAAAQAEEHHYRTAVRNAQSGLKSAEALLREAARHARRSGKDDANVRLTGLIYDLETLVEKANQL